MRNLALRIPLLGLVLAASPAFGQAQTTLVPVQSWVSMEGQTLTAFGNGYYQGFDNLWAALTVPTGVEVDGVCAEVYDVNPAQKVIVSLWAAEAAQGLSAQVPVKLAEADSGVAAAAGGTKICLAAIPPFSFPLAVRTTANLDGLGSPGTVQYYLTAFLPTGDASTLIGPALVDWRRVVSEPPDTATFDDVPTGDPFYQYVEALSAAGIAGSCDGGTNFCPDGPVTRKQLAFYLAKALGLNWPN